MVAAWLMAHMTASDCERHQREMSYLGLEVQLYQASPEARMCVSGRHRTDSGTGPHKSGFLSAIFNRDEAGIVAVSQQRFGYRGDMTFQVSEIIRNT